MPALDLQDICAWHEEANRKHFDWLFRSRQTEAIGNANAVGRQRGVGRREPAAPPPQSALRAQLEALYESLAAHRGRTP